MLGSGFFLLMVVLRDTAAFSVDKALNSSKVKLKRQIYTSCDKNWFPFGELCYSSGGTYYSQMRLSRGKASDRCKELGGRLVSIHSKEVSDFVTAFVLMNGKHHSWIGLNDIEQEGHYKWDDGTEMDFTNWHGNGPTPGDQWEDCVESLYYPFREDGKPGQWNDVNCGAELEFICQKKRKEQGKKYADPRFCSDRDGGGWKLGSSCYHINVTKLTWQEAEESCVAEHGGHLLTVNDIRTNLFVEYILRNYTDDMWIGIKIENELPLKWSSGWYVSFSYWMEDFGHFLEGTCAIRTLDKWTTVPCTRRLPFICETSKEAAPSLKSFDELVCPPEHVEWKDFGGEFCYYFENDHLSWFEAHYRCLRRGGTLASIHSEAEQRILQPFLLANYVKKVHTKVWIGLHRQMLQDDKFVWVDGSPLNFTAWTLNQPSFYKEQCVEVNPTIMEWNDFFCDHRRPSICSARKMSLNRTTDIEVETCSCNDGFSTEVFLGAIFCVLFVAILLGIVIYCFCRQDKDGRQSRKKPMEAFLPTPLLVRKPSFRSVTEMVVNDDGYLRSGFSTEALLGAIFCVLFAAILLGTVVYCICRRDKEEHQKRKTSLVTLPSRLRKQKHKLLSNNEILIEDDSYDIIKSY